MKRTTLGRTPLPETGGSLHTRIRHWLLGHFHSLNLDDRLPSIRELARLMDVSPPTVNNVMIELEGEGYVTRHQGKGTYLASRERVVTRANDAPLAGSGTIVVACPDIFSHSYYLRVHLAEECAVKNGMRVAEFKLARRTRFEGLLAFARESKARGIIVDPPGGAITRQAFDLLDRLDVPVILFAACRYPSASGALHAISGDGSQSGYLRVRCLTDRGHRRIAYVGNEPNSIGIKLAYEGMKQALRDAGMRLRDLVLPDAPRIRAWQDPLEAGHRLTLKLPKRKMPTAIIYDSFAGAFGGMRALHERGLRVPEDVSLIAGGAYAGLERYTVPTMAHVTTDRPAEMRLAFDVLLGTTHQPSRSTLMPQTLIEGESLGVRSDT